MNSDYIPILGERKDKEFMLNIVSFVDAELRVEIDLNSYVLTLKRYTCTSRLINAADETLLLFRLKMATTWIANTLTIGKPSDGMHIFNCDCHFTPETGLWHMVNTSRARHAYHIGDQIYFDAVFVECCRRLTACCQRPTTCCKSEDFTDDDIRALVYETAKVALLRKTKVLQSFYNVMLGDDHDICDDSMRKKYGTEVTDRVTGIIRQAFHDMQASLRLSQDTVVKHGDVKVLLIDNIRNRSDKDYADHLLEEINKLSITKGESLYIMSPKVPMNNKISCWASCIYSKPSNIVNYKPLYEKLLSLPFRQIKIFCGDEHIARSFTIGDDERCELHFVGTMNSVLDSYDSRDFIAGIPTQRILNEKDHSYMTVDDGVVSHHLMDSCCNKWFGCLMYCWHVYM